MLRFHMFLLENDDDDKKKNMWKWNIMGGLSVQRLIWREQEQLKSTVKLTPITYDLTNLFSLLNQLCLCIITYLHAVCLFLRFDISAA